MNKKVKTLIKLIIIKCIPVKKNMLLFTSYDGLYSDSPKCISEKVHELNNKFKIVWLVNENVIQQLPEYVRGVVFDSWKAVIMRAQASVLVDNVYGARACNLIEKTISKRIKFYIVKCLGRKRNQKLYTTWHGTPLKKMGRDQIGNTVYDFALPNATIILNNRYTLDIMNHLTFHKARMLLMGAPRNDILFNGGSSLIEKVKKRLRIPADKKVVLYAPTFRNDGRDVEGKNVRRSGIFQLEEMDIGRLLHTLSDQFGGKWILVCRFHYFVSALVDWNQLNKRYNGKIINGNQSMDMAEYLVCADALITDASSCMFDYMVTKHPCFIYFPDYEQYKNKERGLYCDITKLPFPFSVDFEGLIGNIKRYEEREYVEQIGKLSEEFGFCDKPNAAERIARLILAENQ